MKFENLCLGVFAIIIAITGENVESKVSGDFALTFEGFLPLVDRDYRSKALRSNEFFEKISLSMYRYYMVQHLYAKLAFHRAEDEADVSAFSEFIHSTFPLLPQPIVKYLRAIGDIRLKKAIDGKNVLKYASLMWPNSQGHFGRIDATNHWKYMSLPAPAIVAQAIQEDYFYSLYQNPLYLTFWNLKSDLLPNRNMIANSSECKSPGLPTQNLLGWKPFTELTSQQRRILQSCGITNHMFETVNPTFYVNPCLLGSIHMILHEQSKIFLFEDAGHVRSHDSSMQEKLMYWLEGRDDESPTPFSSTAVHTDQKFTVYMTEEHNTDTDEIVAMAFRVKKGKRFPKWSIFDWSKYQCVPEDWIATSNTVFDSCHSEGRENAFQNLREREKILEEFLKDVLPVSYQNLKM